VFEAQVYFLCYMDTTPTTGRQTMTDKAKAADTLKEIAYRIPGKGGWRRRAFGSEAAADAFIDKLIRKEGDDVEIQCRYED